MNNENKTFFWLKNNYKFILCILGIIITATIAWTNLKAQVAINTEDIDRINNNNDNLVKKIDEINRLLNDKDMGLPALNQRLINLEKKINF